MELFPVQTTWAPSTQLCRDGGTGTGAHLYCSPSSRFAPSRHPPGSLASEPLWNRSQDLDGMEAASAFARLPRQMWIHISLSFFYSPQMK